MNPSVDPISEMPGPAAPKQVPEKGPLQVQRLELIGAFHTWWYPKMDGLQGKITYIYIWIIWGYPHFRKPPIELMLLWAWDWTCKHTNGQQPDSNQQHFSGTLCQADTLLRKQYLTSTLCQGTLLVPGMIEPGVEPVWWELRNLCSLVRLPCSFKRQWRAWLNDLNDGW